MVFQSHHGLEAGHEAVEVLASCKQRFSGASGLTVPKCIKDINMHLEDIKFRIEMVGCDSDGLKYYVFANKVRVARSLNAAHALAWRANSREFLLIYYKFAGNRGGGGPETEVGVPLVHVVGCEVLCHVGFPDSSRRGLALFQDIQKRIVSP